MADKTGPTPLDFFCGTGSSQSSSVPTDNTNKQRKQKRSRENSRQCGLHDLSFLQTRGEVTTERGSWTQPRQQDVGLFFLLWAGILRQHLESASETSTGLRVICPLRLYASAKTPKNPLDKVFLQNMVDNAAMHAHTRAASVCRAAHWMI